MSASTASFPKTPEQWKLSLDALPENQDKIPAFFFGHGSPMLVMPHRAGGQMAEYNGPTGPNARFLRDFGPTLLTKYNPKAIVVFSAHWDTPDERLVSDYGDENPLYYDYYGFPPDLYKFKFKSRGDSMVTQRVIELLNESGMSARASPNTEPRGIDGLNHRSAGLDHGVFIPFQIMFGDEFTEIPIVEVSMDGTLDPEDNWRLGQAVQKLREERVLVLSGGLTIHNLRDFSAFGVDTAAPHYKEFDSAVLAAASETDPDRRKAALVALTKHRAFHAAHPHPDHFIPIYIAAGAGGDGEARIIQGLYGQPTIAFGL